MSTTFVIKDPESGRPYQTKREELANSISHGIGLLAVLAAIPFLLLRAIRIGKVGFIVGTSVFSLTMILLYLTSTLYHAVPRGKTKHTLRIIEHIAIFFLIAGTYTPFTLGVLSGPWGWTLFGLIWVLTLAGLLLKILGGIRYPITSNVLYVLMGWVVLIAVQPLWRSMPHAGFIWIFLGGLAYTGGLVFYGIDYRMKYSHFIWHLFVMAGTVFHFLAVYWYAA